MMAARRGSADLTLRQLMSGLWMCGSNLIISCYYLSPSNDEGHAKDWQTYMVGFIAVLEMIHLVFVFLALMTDRTFTVSSRLRFIVLVFLTLFPLISFLLLSFLVPKSSQSQLYWSISKPLVWITVSFNTITGILNYTYLAILLSTSPRPHNVWNVSIAIPPPPVPISSPRPDTPRHRRTVPPAPAPSSIPPVILEEPTPVVCINLPQYYSPSSARYFQYNLAVHQSNLPSPPSSHHSTIMIKLPGSAQAFPSPPSSHPSTFRVNLPGIVTAQPLNSPPSQLSPIFNNNTIFNHTNINHLYNLSRVDDTQVNSPPNSPALL